MKAILISIFIIFHLTSTVIWNFDTVYDIPNNTINLLKPYMYGMSIWQAWNIFSPDPYTKETSTRFIIETDNKIIPYLYPLVLTHMCYHRPFRQFEQQQSYGFPSSKAGGKGRKCERVKKS